MDISINRREVRQSKVESLVRNALDNLSYHNDLKEMTNFLREPFLESETRFIRLEEISKRPNFAFGGETWMRFWDMLERDVIYNKIINFYEKDYPFILGKYGENLESNIPTFLVTHEKGLRRDKLYPCILKARGDEKPSIFVVINEDLRFADGED